MELIDIGVNMTHRSFDPDRDEVINRAVGADVVKMVVTGTDLKSSDAAVSLAGRYPGVLYSTAGVHPHNARQCDERTLVRLRELASRREVKAIGECGLDFNRDFSPRPLQEQWFEAQLELACELKLPLFLHERDAHQRFVAILRNHRARIERAVVHCFAGGEHELRTYLDMGLHIGITGWICDDRRGVHLRELVRQIPPGRMMLETDAPFLTPRNIPQRPKSGRNEPALLGHVLRRVAESLKMPAQAVADQTTDAARRFFSC